MAFYVFDLDGTLADCTHRVHHVRDGNHNWDVFFNECGKDKPIKKTIALFRSLVEQGHRVEIWSARSAVAEEQTREWLDEHIGMLYSPQEDLPVMASEYLRHMRPEGNYIKDTELKKQWLHLEDEWPDIIFDDRRAVVDMWREEGVTCFQVAPGDFDFIGEKLERIQPVVVGVVKEDFYADVGGI